MDNNFLQELKKEGLSDNTIASYTITLKQYFLIFDQINEVNLLTYKGYLIENYKAKIADNKAIPIYNKYYKRYSARVKVRQIKEADFKKWKYQAMSKRDDCTDGIITPEEFTEWMENSFPNRKPKS